MSILSRSHPVLVGRLVILAIFVSLLFAGTPASFAEPEPPAPTVLEPVFIPVDAPAVAPTQPPADHQVYGPYPEEALNGETVVQFPDLPVAALEDAQAAPSAPDATYTHETAETNDCIQGDVHLALDPNGRPHVTFHDYCGKAVAYRYRTGAGWVGTGFVLGTDRVGTYSDIVVSSDGKPHIVFNNETTGDLWYAYINSAGSWAFEIVDSNSDTGYHCSLALDGAGHLQVAYQDKTHGALLHKYRDSTGWHSLSEVVTDGSFGDYAELAVEPTGPNYFPHIFYSGLSSRLYHAWQPDAISWSIETVNSNVGFFGPMSAAVDSNRYPHVSYYDSANLDLMYSYKQADGWHTLRFSNAGGDRIGYSNSIDLDSNNSPHIAYWNATQNELWLAYNHQGAGWVYEQIYNGIVPPADENNWMDLILDLADEPVVAYMTEIGSSDVRVASSVYAPPSSPLGYLTTTMNQRDTNRCAFNVVSQFNSLRDHGEVMGFNLEDHPEPEYDISDASWHSHWQGLQRLMSGGGRYMVFDRDLVKRNTTCGGSPCVKEYSGLAFVYLGTRNGLNDRYRSNRLDPDLSLGDTPPPISDYVVNTLYISSDQNHPGGIQAMGNILVVSTEMGDDTELRFYDLTSNPGGLSPDAPPMPWAENLIVPGSSGTAVALTKLTTGRYLLAVIDSGPKGLSFYISYAPNTLSGSGQFLRFLPLDWMDASEVVNAAGTDFPHKEWDQYQAINFVTECATQKLFLIATGNRDSTSSTAWAGCPFHCLPDGEDTADLFQLSISSGNVKLTRMAQRHFYCNQHSSGKHCNFDAAAGAYVNASGQLYLYAGEHDNNGPDQPDGGPGTVKFMEFRPVPHNSSCSTTSTAWVELYDHPFSADSLGEGLMIDYPDRYDENYFNYDDAHDFDNQAESARWCLPEGLSYRIFQEQGATCDGKLLVLYGRNAVSTISDLDDVGMKEKPSCSYFYNDPAETVGFTPSGGRLIYPYKLFKTSSRPSEALVSQPQAVTGYTITLTTTLDLPSGALATNTNVKYLPTTPNSEPHAKLWVGAHGFTLSLTPAGNFLKPVTVKIYYDDNETVEIYPDTLFLAYYDTVAQTWVDASATCGAPIPVTLNQNQHWLSTVLCKAGEYAVFGNRIYTQLIPIMRK